MTQCGFVGNSDIYGLGIRLGYYSQVLAVWISNYFFVGEAKPLRAVNNIFLLALIVAGFIYFANARQTFAIEAFLLLQIGLVIGLVGITETRRYATKYRATSRERLLLRMTIWMFGGFFNAIFYWEGINVLLPTPCGTYVFCFCKANVYGWFKILMRVESLIAALWAIPNIVSWDVANLYYDVRMEQTRSSFVNAVCANSQSVKLQPIERSTLSIKTSGVAEKYDARASTALAIHDLVQEKDADTLKAVLKAERYLDSILSIYSSNSALSRETRQIRCFGGHVTFKIPKEPRRQCNDSTPYKTCIATTIKAVLYNKPPMHLRNRLSLHTMAIGAVPFWKWPRLINRMHELDRTCGTPDWRHFTIASDLRLSQTSVPNSTLGWTFDAGRQFLFIVLLVLRVELTLAWNHVSDLQSLANLGQLIPFILGVGSLAKIFWGKGRAIWKKDSEDGWRREGPLGDYEKAMARYIELKTFDAGRPFTRAATA